MHAMVLRKLGAELEWTELADRRPGPGEIRPKISTCGVCSTDLHVDDGELPDPKTPIIPGHEIVGRINAIGAEVESLRGSRRRPLAGPYLPWVPLLCRRRENLCDRPLFTGYTRDGGFATATIADARYAFPLGDAGDDVSLAPLLCAGLIGWRSLKMAGEGKRLGLSRRLGATWAGGSDDPLPEPVDAAIIFAPVGDLVPLALKAVHKGGRVICV